MTDGTFIGNNLYSAEVIRKPAGGYKSALFDFDGTASLLREGWREVMIPYFAEVLMEADPNADYDATASLVADFVDALTGKQTIFQCRRLASELENCGKRPLDPYEYKKEYLRRLMERVAGRHKNLREGCDSPEQHLVRGVVGFLTALRERGVKLYLASGTDEADVISEARLLGLDGFFDGGIYGALDSDPTCSKETVIARILSENAFTGRELLGFGDGFVEISLIKDAGGYAVAVATDEARREGVNPWKRERLLGAGADAVIPDFADYEFLDKFLFGEV